MSLVNIHDLKSQKLENCWYIGRVVDNNDSTKLNRVRLRCDFLHSDILDQDLPWAIPDIFSPHGNGSNFGGQFIPMIGVNVFFKLQDNSILYPIYTTSPCLSGSSVATADNDFSNNYPYTYGFKDGYDNKFLLDPIDKKFIMRLSNNTTITIDLDKFTITKTDGNNFQSSNLDITNRSLSMVTDEVDIETITSFNITSPQVNIQGYEFKTIIDSILVRLSNLEN